MFNRLQYASPWIKTAQILPQICMQKQITNYPSDIKVLDEAWDILQYMGKVRAIINISQDIVSRMETDYLSWA